MHDPRFGDPLSRHRHQDELEELVESWTRRHDYYEVTHLLQGVGIPAGPVLDEAAAFEDPHLKERGIFVEVSQADTGTHLYPGPLAQMRNTPFAIRRPPVRLGEHNDHIYKEVLGIGEDEYDKLVETGHIGTAYAPGVRAR